MLKAVAAIVAATLLLSCAGRRLAVPSASFPSAPTTASATTGTPYCDPEGDFVVTFPARSIALVRGVSDEIEGVRINFVGKVVDDVRWGAQWFDLSREAVASRGPSAMLRSIMRGSVEDTQVLDMQRESDAMGGRLLEYTAHRAEGVTDTYAPAETHVYLLLKGTRGYRVHVDGAERGIMREKDVREFFASFRVGACR